MKTDNQMTRLTVKLILQYSLTLCLYFSLIYIFARLIIPLDLLL
jgi:hypothetical protein